MSSTGVDGTDSIQISIDELGAPQTNLIEDPTNDTLSLFLLQVVLILVIVRSSAKLLSRLRQPVVIGEIIAGIILGPSVLGFIPGFESKLFPIISLATLNIFAQIGLIFFMFFLGLELDPKLFRRNWKSALPISLVSVLIPFSLGCAVSPLIYSLEQREEFTIVNRSTFALFIGTTLAFTAFPLLARILTSFRLLATPFGEHVLAIAACDDILAWCALALTLGYAGNASVANGFYTALITIAYLLFMFLCVRPALKWINSSSHFRQVRPDTLNRDYITILILMLSLSSMWSEIQGIHAFFGAFIAGLIVPKGEADKTAELLCPKIELLVVEFFLPLYFAYSGLRTTMGQLNSGEVIGIAILVTLLKTIGKVVPVTLMSHLMTRYFGMTDADFDFEDLGRLNTDANTAVNVSSSLGKEMEMPSIDFSEDSYAYDRKPASHVNGKSNVPSNPTDSSSSSDSAASPRSNPQSLWNSGSGGGFSGMWNSDRNRYSWRTCLSVGVLMNTTGLVTLIALNVGLDRKIIGQKVFSLLVLMALITTFLTSPIFNYLFYVPNLYSKRARMLVERKQREIKALKDSGDDSEKARNALLRKMEELEDAKAEEESQHSTFWCPRWGMRTTADKELQHDMDSPFDTNAPPMHPINAHVMHIASVPMTSTVVTSSSTDSRTLRPTTSTIASSGLLSNSTASDEMHEMEDGVYTNKGD